MNERWKPIANYVGIYECSDLGNVRRLVSRGHISLPEPKILKPWLTLGGYPTISLSKPRSRHALLVHRIIAKHFIGESNGLEVNHKNGIKTDNRLVNLEYMTRSENATHAKIHGKYYKGTQCHSAKLNPRIVRVIRKSTKTQYYLAAKYEVKQSTISCIQRGLTWRHICN